MRLPRMREDCPPAELFRIALRHSLAQNPRDVETLTVRRNRNVFTEGDAIDMVYIVERGEVKLVVVSPTGRECLLAVRTTGDIVGESIFTGRRRRAATATAMTETRLKRMPRSVFIERLSQERMLERFLAYCAAQGEERDRTIVSLVTAQGERRLGDALLALAQKIGTRDAASNARIAVPLSHEELAAMIGMTRPRVSEFMQKFRRLDLVVAERQELIVRERALAEYLSHTK